MEGLSAGLPGTRLVQNWIEGKREGKEMSLLSNLVNVGVRVSQYVEVSNLGVLETRDHVIIFDDGDFDNLNFYDIFGKVIESVPLPKK